jgi:hypothetical protein
MRRWGLALVAAAVLLVRPVRASADDAALAQARTAVENSDYMTARTALEKALSDGGAEPDELAEIYKLTGIVEAALGNTKEATAAFGKWLALEPKGTLPQGTSPKITRPFDAAHKKAPKLDLKTETSADPPKVTLVIGIDPVGISRARVLVSVDGKTEHEFERDGGGAQKIAIDLPRGHRLDLRVEALDVHGNRIAVLGSKDVPIVIVTQEKVEPDKDKDKIVEKKALETKKDQVIVPAHERAWYARWRVWGIAAGVGVVVSGAMVYKTHADISDLEAKNANSPDYAWGAGRDAESTARRDLLITNIAVGVTGALAVGTALFYLTRPHEEVQLVAVPVRGGGAVSLGGHF